MLRYWSSNDCIRTVADDTRTLSLHVLSSAGFGKSYPFRGHLEESPVNVATSYKESLQTILDNCILLMVLGQEFLSRPWLPSKLKKMHKATMTFKRYMAEMYEEEKTSMAEGIPGGGNLMTSLIRSSIASTNSSDQTLTHGQNGLTESEIYGNVFIFNFAGHDTTAHTLAFAIVLLAAHPSIQNWVSEEIRHVLGQQIPYEWNYQAAFPRLKRCQALLVSLLDWL